MRHQLKNFRACCLCLSLLTAWSLCAPAQDILQPQKAPRRTGQMPQERMEVVARALKLGAKRADSESPRTTQSGHGAKASGYYQCFERGCVYYGAGTGVHAVSGVIFEKYVADGYERGALGFPVSDEKACGQPAGFRYQIFEGGRIVSDDATGQTTTYPNRSTVGDAGDCRSEWSRSPTPRAGSSAGAANTARFRVTLNGFTAHSQTWDSAAQEDGRDDEVYIVSDARVFGRSGAEMREHASTVVSEVMGDVNGFGSRVQAGSAGDTGGIRSGDSFPFGRPWARGGSVAGRKNPPLVLWEGELSADQNVAVIIPTIWEWDWNQYGRVDVRQETLAGWRRTIAANTAAIGGVAVLTAFGGQTGGDGTAPYLTLAGGTGLLADIVGRAGDRPIGVRKGDGGGLISGGWVFNPRALTLSFRIAEKIIASDAGKGRGVVLLKYEDDPGLRGLYTLYVQVERLP